MISNIVLVHFQNGLDMKMKRFNGSSLSKLCRWVTSRYQLVLLSFILATLCISNDIHSTLEKFLEEERNKHNPSLRKSDKYPFKSQDDKMTVGGGQLVDTISNKENVTSLKSALKDPSFVRKIGQLEELEDRRQQLYLNILKKRGQIVVAPDGAQTIISYPKVLYTNLTVL